jgi:hypothetical protein
MTRTCAAEKKMPVRALARTPRHVDNESMGRTWIGVRLTDVERERIRTAAHARKLTLNDFVVEAALRAAEELNRPGQPRLTGFALLCQSAAYGSRGYKAVGFNFAKDLRRLVGKGPGSSAKLRELRCHLKVTDPDAAPHRYGHLLKWCAKHFPELMELVPRRRYKRFAEGFLDAYRGSYAKI